MQRHKYLVMCSVISLFFGDLSNAMLSVIQKTETNSNKMISINTDNNDSIESLIDESYLLLSAADNYNVTKFLIEYGADVKKARDQNGYTPLLYATCRGNYAVVKLLIENGANVNATTLNGDFPLICAAYLGYNKSSYHTYNKIAKLLIEHGANIEKQDGKGATPFKVAKNNKNIDFMKLLIEKKMKPNKNTMNNIIHKVDTNSSNIASTNTDNKDSIVSFLDGSYLLLKAANNYNVTKFLIEHGANVKKAMNQQGHTPLLYASYQGNYKVAKLLIDNGADVNATTIYNDFPLIRAMYMEHYDIAKLLIENGADINKIDENNATPLKLANKTNKLDLMNWLTEMEQQSKK